MVKALVSAPVTTSLPLATSVLAIVEVPPSVQSPVAFTVSVPKFWKLLSASPVPCRTSALVAPVAVLPMAAPVRVEPVCSVSVLAPAPLKTTEPAPPLIVPALLTEPPPVM